MTGSVPNQPLLGSRALDFVLTSKSDNVDKTLLLNFKVVRVDKPGGKYKF